MVDQLKNNFTDNTLTVYKQIHNMIEYQVAVYGIFVERPLDRARNLSIVNIDTETANIQKIMKYFED